MSDERELEFENIISDDEITEDQPEELNELEADLPISEEPELIAEISSPESTSKSQEEESPHLTSTVCDVCLELNLTQAQHIIKCERCEQAFCFHFASNIDARYCVNCMSDISVTKQVISKEYVHRDEHSNITSVYRRRAREVKIDGLSWLFAQRKVVELSDVELDMAIEYHRNIMILMIDEQERRRNARMHRYANKFYIPTPSTTTVSDTTHTTVKKTRTVSKNKQQEQLNALLGTMGAKGININKIMSILNSK